MLSVTQAAEALGLSVPTIRAWIWKRRNLPYVKVGRSIRIPAAAIEHLVKQNTVLPINQLQKRQRSNVFEAAICNQDGL